MKHQISLDITSPCSENYNAFTPTTKGGFCDTCTKEVIDFTTMSAQDTIAYFKNNSSKNTCGRFKSHQLRTYDVQPKTSKRLSFLSGIGLACLSLFSFNTAQGQDVKKQTSKSEDDAAKIIKQKHDKEFVVKGNVSESSIPLPGTNIILEGTTVGTITDFDGNFTFPQKLKKGDVLVFSYVGFQSQKVVITNKDSVSKIELQIDMESSGCFFVGKVAVKKVYKSKS